VAEQVCADERIDRYEILDLLGRLVDKSLVAAAESKSATRYRILETVRQYAREKLLESGEGEAIRDRHVSAYLELVEEAEPKIRSADQPLWLDRLEEEIDNLRAALEWSREREAENCLRLASALWRFCDIRGYWREAIDWLTQTLSATESLKTLSRARALARTAHLMSNRQNWDAEPLAEEAYRLGSELGDQSSIARALFVLGSIEIQRYHGQRGTDLLKQSLELARNIGDHGLAAALLLKLGWQARDTDLQSSTSLMNQGIEEARRSGDGRVICYGLVNYIDNLLVQGRIEEARNLARESHQLAETIGDYNHMVYSQVALADIGLFLEDYGLAEEYANQALDLARSRSDEIELSGPMFDLALVALARGEVEKVSAYGQQLVRLGEKSLIRTMLVTGKWVIGRAEILTGDFAAAERYLKEALVVAREDNFLPGICFFLEEFAVLAIAQDQHTRGVVLLGARERLRESVFIVEFPISVRQRDEYASRAREQLSEQALDEAWQRGRALSVDEAVAYAFETAHG
jgi:hypothetical protein